MLTVLRRARREYWTAELRAATGRSLIRHLLSALNRPAVLMPSYVPEGVLGPCQDAGVPISFYDLHPDLTPNEASVFQNMPQGAMVVVIHYFGYPSPTYGIRQIANAAHGILFEDCAHTLYGDVSKASNADIALWSLNKFMPVTDGAILRLRGANLITHPAIHGFPEEDSYQEHLRINAKIAESDGGLELACLQQQSNDAYEKYYKFINECYTLYAQTERSKLIESQFDIEKEQAIRKANAWRMSMILPSLRSQDLPQFAYPLMCKSAEHREIVAERLLSLGILAARQVDKWRCEGVDDFIDRHLLLPLGDVFDAELIGQIKATLW